MLNTVLIPEVAHFLAASRNGSVTMGKLLVAVYGESARGNSMLRRNLGTLATLLENRGYVGCYKRGKRNQSYHAELKGLDMIKDYPGWDKLCTEMDEWMEENYG